MWSHWLDWRVKSRHRYNVIKNLKASTANFPWDTQFFKLTKWKQVYACAAVVVRWESSLCFYITIAAWWFFNDLPVSIYVSHSLCDVCVCVTVSSSFQSHIYLYSLRISSHTFKCSMRHRQRYAHPLCVYCDESR